VDEQPHQLRLQWQQCDGSGNNCTAISGATGQTYTAVAGDVGHTLRVQETASNAGGASGPATSSATAAVDTPASQQQRAPTISGTAQQAQTLTEAHARGRTAHQLRLPVAAVRRLGQQLQTDSQARRARPMC